MMFRKPQQVEEELSRVGTIQQATEKMGPYGTEIRSESFRLTVSGPVDSFNVKCAGRYHFTVPAAHVPHILAALDQVTEHLSWREWDGESRTGVVSVKAKEDLVLLGMTCPVYAQDWGDEHGHDASVSVEIEYRDLEDLRRKLEAL